jgi:branched-chain amino acid transport system permease protein
VFKKLSTTQRNLSISLLFFFAIFLLGHFVGAYNQNQISVALTLFIGILSINILTGLSGQLSLGQSALMAIGGYACGLLMTKLGMSMWLSIVLSAIAAAVAGLLLGAVAAKLSGPYLAGTTLVLALALPTVANKFSSVFGGESGISIDTGTPPQWLISILGDISFEEWQILVTLPFAVLALFVAANLFTSRSGRSWRAVRDHESAASLMGINVARTKVLVFIISSSFAGIAGALFGLRGLVGTSVYPIALSLSLLTGSILGGMRSLLGAGIGSIAIVFLSDWIGKLSAPFHFSDQITNYLPALVTGALLVFMVVINPGGIASTLYKVSGQLRVKFARARTR